MQVENTDIDGLILISPRIFRDSRGYFFESYSQREFEKHGIAVSFVQDNHSASVGGTLRGMHFQSRRPQDKLLRVLRGEIFDVAIDLRPSSPTFGRWQGFHLSAENARQLFVPKGFAHGFYVLGDYAEIAYKCSDFYFSELELSLAWNDPDIAIAWPLSADPVLSARDAAAPQFKSLDFSSHCPEKSYQISPIKKTGA